MLVMVHIEVQATKSEDLVERLFFYYTRIFESYRKPVTTLVILADRNSSWRPNHLESVFAGTSVRFDFPVVKLLDYKSRLAELESSKNIFALLTAATLHAQARGSNSPERMARKFRLTSRLYELGLGRTQIVDFFRIIDHVLTLSPRLDREFLLELEKYEEENVMSIKLLSNIERRAMEKVRKEERERTKRVEQELQRERQRAEQLAARLRELGVDPDSF